MDDRLTRAKSIDMVSYLSSQGYSPVRERDNDVLFNSPFRSEASPSFYVSRVTNKWADFGRELKRFDIIDFVMEHESCTLTEAIDKLLGGSDLRPAHVPQKANPESKAIEVVEVQEDVTNEALIEYFEDVRGIPIQVVNKYCNQVAFRFGNRRYVTYYGVGMLNSAGGFSIRGLWFKGATAPSSYTVIKHTEGATQIALFEGMTDFLSYVMLEGEPDYDVIVLNSLVYIPFLIDKLKTYQHVHAWLDTDSPADEKMELMRKEGISLTDHREVYKGYKDINEYYTNAFTT